jgi:hypothetical protein
MAALTPMMLTGPRSDEELRLELKLVKEWKLYLEEGYEEELL